MSFSTPPVSKRILATDEPCIVQMQKMMAGKEGVLSLAQGIVHWKPPQSVGEAARTALEEDDTNSYCGDDGLVALRSALLEKIRNENGLASSSVMVTSGSNQGYMNVVLSLLSEGDTAVLFRPYYFNHMMALQMVGASVEVSAVDAHLLPDLRTCSRICLRLWNRKRMSSNKKHNVCPSCHVKSTRDSHVIKSAGIMQARALALGLASW